MEVKRERVKNQGGTHKDFTWVDSGLFLELSGRNTEDKIVFYT